MPGNAVRARRIELGLTQEQLAIKAGLTLRTVCRVEANDNMPTLATLSRLAAALETEVGRFLAEQGSAA